MTILGEQSSDASDHVWRFVPAPHPGILLDDSACAEVTVSPLAAEEYYEFEDYRLYPQRRTLLRDNKPVSLGARAFDLLILLANQAGVVLSARDLIHGVWRNITVEEANLRVQMAILRKALSQSNSAQRAIETIPLRGYCFVLPVRYHPSGVEPGVSKTASFLAPPSLLYPVVGREETIRLLLTALDERRLVTITGPGGMGKTTTAIAAANRYSATYRGQVAFVDLSQATDGATAAKLLTEALRIEPLGDLLAAMGEYLRAREVLLILDTCEHLVEPIACMAERLLASCDTLKLLVTSREALRATGEWTHRLASLTFPAEGSGMAEDKVADYSAVALFIDRAQASIRGAPCIKDLSNIAEICRRLDGIPLALEFAAARVADLGLAQIAARLDDRFAILTRGRRTALPRHRTLATALDWSYDLLSADEQLMLRRLAVGNGPFSEEKALVEGEQAGCDRTTDAFFGLFEKSLICVDMRHDGPSYSLLDTTRAYVNGLIVGSTTSTPQASTAL